LVLVEEEALDVSEIPNAGRNLSSEEIPRHVQELEVSSRGPTVRETPGQFVVVHLDVDEMLHPTKAVGECPGKLIPLHGNGLNIA